MNTLGGGNQQMAYILLRAGATTEDRDKNGHDAYWYARHCQTPINLKNLIKFRDDPSLLRDLPPRAPYRSLLDGLAYGGKTVI